MRERQLADKIATQEIEGLTSSGLLAERLDDATSTLGPHRYVLCRNVACSFQVLQREGVCVVGCGQITTAACPVRPRRSGLKKWHAKRKRSVCVSFRNACTSSWAGVVRRVCG
jgi:hypothetical protein